VEEEHAHLEQPHHDRPELPARHDTLEVLPGVPAIVTNKDAPSQKTGKTLLSGTEATQHHQTLDEIVDTKSVTSYAVTVKDLHGKGVELPQPPRAAYGDRDFECPYCYIICPARYGRGRAWRTHLLQDLQPYVCTYRDCKGSDQLFRSRREWAEHEASHRKAWRCPEHPNAVYKTSIGLKEHYRSQHADNFTESQLSAIVRVGETTTIDERSSCPLCCAPANIEGLGDFHNHIANHLERIATFALPNGTEDDSDGASSAASRGRSDGSETRNMSDISLPKDVREEEPEIDLGEKIHWKADLVPGQTAIAGSLLSAESLGQLPDGSQDRLGTLLAGFEIQSGESKGRPGPDTDSSSYSTPSSYAVNDNDANKVATLKVTDIPTVSSLYRTRRLQQRDQSVAPNASYNQIISFCHHDLTKLKVDAIVNSANKSLKMTSGKTLNNAIHKAAGPELAAETRQAGKLEGQAILTGGHKLPSQHIIHVLRPGYSRSRGIGQFNQLIDCYREVFKVAIDHKLKTIALPCLGTGGVGFPARVAARITLQEIREYLDTHPEHKFERIIFCVNTAADEKAYIDFLPVYFPPTHADLDTAKSVWSEDWAGVTIQVLDTRNEIQKVFSELNLGLSLSVPGFPQDILTHFAAIDSALASIRRFLLWSKELSKNLRDLKLLCSVVQLFCGNVTEIIDLAKDHANLGQRSDQEIWDDYVTDMTARQGIKPSEFLQASRDLAEGLDSMITGNGYDLDEIIEMVETREMLERFRNKQRGSRGAEGTQEHLNEVLYTREFQREAIAHSRDVVKLHQIRSVAQLYQIGELEDKPTLALPSELFNERVYLVREDVTKLEVDVLVNSTDVSFRGMGTLDRTVLQKGGPEMRQAVEAFGTCKVGDVRSTEGYMLPAKHVLHVVPPGVYNKEAKDTLRRIYRDVLHEAVIMRAASIALPSIGELQSFCHLDACTDWITGTGMLNYPRRDSASLALEEIKRFLESAERNNLIEKIILVVYSSNDEFVYKSLLPVYFPPPNVDTRSMTKFVGRQDTGTSATSDSSEAPRRTLFGSIGEAFRSVRLGKQPETSRAITANEEHALIEFESHAKYCETCVDVYRLYAEGRDLCKDGLFLAQTVDWHMKIQPDDNVYTSPDAKGQTVKLEFPRDMFPISTRLLRAVAISNREGKDGKRGRPFLTTIQPWNATSEDQTGATSSTNEVLNDANIEEPGHKEPKRARARVLVTLDSNTELTEISPNDCRIEVRPDRVVVFKDTDDHQSQRLMLSLGFNPFSVVQRYKTTPEVQLNGVTRLVSSTLRTKGMILFRCKSDEECNRLLRALRQAIENIQDSRDADDKEEAVAQMVEPEGKTSDETLRRNTLHDELAAHPRASGGLGDIDFKVDRLSAAGSNASTSSQQYPEPKLIADPALLQQQAIPGINIDLQTSFEPPEFEQQADASDAGHIDIDLVMKNLGAARSKLETTQQQKYDASNLYDFSKTRLATRILLCLTADLKSRPGSYIGLDTDTIVSSLGAEKIEVLGALKGLEAADQVHNTVNKDTWVITHAPKDLPVLSNEQLEAGINPAITIPETSSRAKQISDPEVANEKPNYVECDACDNPLPRGAIVSYPTAKPGPSASQTLGPTAQKVFAHLVEFAKVPEHGGLHILDVASATGVSQEEVGDVLAVLEAAGMAHIHGTNALWWAATTKHIEGILPGNDKSKTMVDDQRATSYVPHGLSEQTSSVTTTENLPSVDVYDRKKYEQGFDVEVQGFDRPFKVAYNFDQNRYVDRYTAAREFLDDNHLPLMHQDQIAELILQDMQNATPGKRSAPYKISFDSTPTQTVLQSHKANPSGIDAGQDREIDAGAKPPRPQLSPTTKRVHDYLLHYPIVPPDNAHHILDIAAAIYLPREEVKQALVELRDLGLANVNEKDGWWRATKAEGETEGHPGFGKHLFTWGHPGEEVYVTGTFDDWRKTVKLEKVDGIFQKLVRLPKRRTEYKFVVDGSWTVNDSYRLAKPVKGTMYNVLEAEDIVDKSQEEARSVVGMADTALGDMAE
jgi:O-acetyl-ADP-ribose deacetylase (regulator of RNase III)